MIHCNTGRIYGKRSVRLTAVRPTAVTRASLTSIVGSRRNAPATTGVILPTSPSDVGGITGLRIDFYLIFETFTGNARFLIAGLAQFGKRQPVRIPLQAIGRSHRVCAVVRAPPDNSSQALVLTV